MQRNNDSTSCRASTACEGKLLLWIGCGFALGAFLLLIAAGIGTRLGGWHFRTGFAILRYAAYSGVVATLMTLAAIVNALVRRRYLGVVSAAVIGMMAITSVAVPYYWKRTAERLPRIHDISTDLDNPPRFVAILPLRQGADNPVEYGGAEVAAKQRSAYPDLKSKVVDIPAGLAFAKALDAAHRLGWEIVATEPVAGRIEATDTTFWFGFKDDIVIRVSPEGSHARVDIRSLSRVGVSDVGTNARRIRNFLRTLASLSEQK